MERIIALAGNPNVGKSTVFNALTGMHQHTGNWPGKTVSNARGIYTRGECRYEVVDLPGCYSLSAHSQEEEIARDYICFGNPDMVVIVCDATCLERNLNLALQIIEAAENVILCVNLMDEAKKKNIHIDLNILSQELMIPVVGMTARNGKGLQELSDIIREQEGKRVKERVIITYPEAVEKAVEMLESAVHLEIGDGIDTRWVSVRLLDADENFLHSIEEYIEKEIVTDRKIMQALKEAKELLGKAGIEEESLQDVISETFTRKAEEISRKAVRFINPDYRRKDRSMDRIFTGKWTGVPIMFGLLFFIFWLTISGANVPSDILSQFFEDTEVKLLEWAQAAGIPGQIYEPFIFGIYRVTTWVVSVMLPPMAIFFPMFTLLEDFGYLPRIAYNLDRCFKCCHACGKQALSMCMGLGCNAVGVTGCRIIDSPRERLIAIITNSFVPCNGKFPTIICMISLFLVKDSADGSLVFWQALALAGVLILGVGMTFLISGLLSRTVLKGIPSSFVLELPPYRRPQVVKVIIRSMLDRTVFVLGRAVLAAAPAGLLIWVLANIMAGDQNMLTVCAEFLEPFARLMGLDGAILLAFILGFPANEIVLPIAAMIYLSGGTLTEIGSIAAMKGILTAHGWTWKTAVSTILFSLMHWPCATTCQTIYKETKSVKWTALSVIIPTIAGAFACMIFTALVKML